MHDSQSSEEEVFKRRRLFKEKKDLRSLFDESSEEHHPIEEEEVRSTLFNEIFGTGREYFFEESQEEEEDSVEAPVPCFSATECKKFVEWNLGVEFKNLERFVDLLLQGYSLQFVMLHDIEYDIDIYTGLKIEESIEDFKDFSKAKAKSKYKEEIYSWDALKYVPKYEEARKKYKDYGSNKYLLRVEQLETNLKDREMVFMPCTYEEGVQNGKKDNGEDGWGDAPTITTFNISSDFCEDEYVFQMSTSIVIRDFIVQNGNPEKFFILPQDAYNVERKRILQRVVEKVNPPEKENKDTSVLFNRIVDRVFNGALKRLESNEKIVSLTKETSLYQGVVMDHKGFVVEKFKMSKNDLENMLDDLRPYCVLLSGTSPTIRLAMQNLIGRNCLYVENCWFDKKNSYDFCTRIGRLALFPEIEYIRIYKSGFNKEIVLNEVLEEESTTLSTEDIHRTIKKAILTSISMTGLDLNLLLAQPDKIDLFAFLGLHSVSRLFSGESYSNLSHIEELIPEKKDFINIVTFLRLFKEYSQVEQPLDETNVHLINYNVIEDTSTQTHHPPIESTNYSVNYSLPVSRIKESVTACFRPEFCGFPDSIAFKNLSGFTPGLIGSVLEGRVFFVDDSYLLVSVLNNVTVFVRSPHSLYINQMVKVRILEANEAFVSFNGEIVEEEKKRVKYPRFCKHPLYKNLDAKEAEKYLEETQDKVLLRKSTSDNSPILVFLFYNNIFVHFKLSETPSGSTSTFSFKGREYSSIDQAITLLVKGALRKVQEISKHKHFHPTEESAIKSLEGQGNFIRYAFYFPREYPGRLCFVFGSSFNKEYLGVYDNLTFRGQAFETLDEFIMWRKRQ
ncbi:Transcription elongation factor spt6 [Nosema granulosis]|uniref:Transcription elongation factor spt6 n=1 Tax=Nosema granulosis TaxID=83296 RepID=A0A9P6KZW5_9MICR|nr:Transcription elongation factor spt6 [Nosema granulosis]